MKNKKKQVNDNHSSIQICVGIDVTFIDDKRQRNCSTELERENQKFERERENRFNIGQDLIRERNFLK